MYAGVDAVATGWRRWSGSHRSGCITYFMAGTRAGLKTVLGGLADQLPEAFEPEAKSVACGPFPFDAVSLLHLEQAFANQ